MNTLTGTAVAYKHSFAQLARQWWAGGVLTAIGTIIVTLTLRRDGRFTSVRELSPIVLTGLVFATVMLGSMSVVRLALFGLGPMGF